MNTWVQVFNPEKPSQPPRGLRTLRCAQPEEGEQSSPAAGGGNIFFSQSWQ